MTSSAPGKRTWLIWIAVLAVWLLVALPLALGERTFFFRDVFFTHLPLKAFGAEQLRLGRIPVFNPTWGLGQVFRGNPNALPFYPGNILYLLLPFWSAFNLHYALHWLIAMLSMRQLALEMRQSRAAALMAGLTYAGSGWILSCLTFYNILTVAAWWPLVLWGAARGGRRGLALGGLACGLALLGGDPVTAALGLVPLLVVAVGHHGWRRGLASGFAVGGLGLLVALPQMVATMRVLPFTFRGAHGVLPADPGIYSVHPFRLLELLVPLPFGWPGDLGRWGFWADEIVPRLPFVFTLYCGIVGLWLALAAVRRQWAWGLLAAGGLAGAWLTGFPGLGLDELTAGLARHPEKLLFWTALALALLAGWGLDRLLEDGRPWGRIAAWAAAAGLVLATIALLNGSRLVEWLRPLVDEQDFPGKAATQTALWIIGLVVAGLSLALAAWGAHRRRAGIILAAQLLCLLQLFPLLLTEPVSHYREPAPWVDLVAPARAVINATSTKPLGVESPPYALQDTSVAVLKRMEAMDLDYAPGVLHGLTYPLAPDFDGMHTPLFTFMLINLRGLTWVERLSWFRSLGVEAVVMFDEPELPGLTLLDRASRHGVDTRLFRVEDPAEPVWWPQEIAVVESPIETFRRVTHAPDPLAGVVVPKAIDHDASGQAHLISATPDRLELEVESTGGVVVVRRAFHPLLVARAAGERLDTLPVNLNLLGIEVPAGRHRILVQASSWPELVAGLLAVLAVAAALWMGFRKPSNG